MFQGALSKRLLLPLRTPISQVQLRVGLRGGSTLPDGSALSHRGAFLGFKAKDNQGSDPPGIHPNWIQAGALII